MRTLIAILVLICLGGQVHADTSKEKDEVDYVALAARLVQDGHYQRASQVLEEVDTEDETLDRKRYFVLKGLVALKSKLYIAAAEAFKQAVGEGNDDPLVLINWARASFGAKDYRSTVDILRRASETAQGPPQRPRPQPSRHSPC